MLHKTSSESFKNFRQQLHDFFPYRSDVLMDLIDALAGNTSARSPVELSLIPAFQREYPSVFDAIENFFKPKSPGQNQKTSAGSSGSETIPTANAQRIEQEKKLFPLIVSTLPSLQKRGYHLFVIDATSHPRPFSRTLADRSFVHAPNPIKGNRPVTIGHQYSVLVYIPEKENQDDPKWIVPFSARRVDTQTKATVVGAEQIIDVVGDANLPFHQQLCVKVGDTAYSAIDHTFKIVSSDKTESLVNIDRLRSSRTLYQLPPPFMEGEKHPVGHPTWYGQPFKLPDEKTWHDPDEIIQTTITTPKDKILTLEGECWNDMLMTGKKDKPMHEYPFRLVRVRWLDDEGKPVFNKPIWLMVSGKRRDELSLQAIIDAYQQRYDIEHFFRFGKQKLLLTAYQTPEVEHEENWWQIVMLAYVQLWLVRQLAQQTLRPWERYQTPKSTTTATPSAAQRDYSRITQQFGTPAKSPKPRGNSPGRQKGEKSVLRVQLPVIKKLKKSVSPP